MRGRVPKGGGQGFNPLPSTGPRQKAVLSKLVQTYSSLPHKREKGLGPFVKISFLVLGDLFSMKWNIKRNSSCMARLIKTWVA